MRLHNQDKGESSLIYCIERFLHGEGSDDDACNLLEAVRHIYKYAFSGSDEISSHDIHMLFYSVHTLKQLRSLAKSSKK